MEAVSRLPAPCHKIKVKLWTWRYGPVCSKLTTSLVNVSLKFQTLISEKCQNFCAKSFSHFFNKKFSVFGCKVVKHLTSWPLNELVNLTMIWTTGAQSLTSVRLQEPNLMQILQSWWTIKWQLKWNIDGKIYSSRPLRNSGSKVLPSKHVTLS